MLLPPVAGADTFSSGAASTDSLASRLEAGARDSTLLAWQAAIQSDLAVRTRTIQGLGTTTSTNTEPLTSTSEAVWHEILSQAPTNRESASLTYDPARDRLILFGGDDRGFFRNEVWELTLDATPAWHRLFPVGVAPLARSRHSAMYDPVRGCIIMFGGWDGINNFNDVWRLTLGDSLEWSEVFPAGALPDPRTGHTATYDPIEDRMLVAGGARITVHSPRDDQQPLQDLWALSLATSPTWSPVLPLIDGPRERSYHAAIYDTRHAEAVFVGGQSRYGVSNDLWAWRSGRRAPWRRIPMTSPNPGSIRDVGATYDSKRGNLVLFGGMTPYYQTYQNQTWTFELGDSAEATLLNPSGPPPSPRAGHSAIYDPINDRVLVFGGWDGSATNREVWQLALNPSPSWSRVPIAGQYLSSPRAYHSAIVDPVRARMVVFGGWDGYAFLNDTWTFSLIDNSWSRLPMTGRLPYPTDGQVAVYDSLGDRMLVFGGNNPLLGIVNDLWSLSFATNTWTHITSATAAPDPHWMAAATFDPLTQSMLIHGGNLGGDNSFPELLAVSVAPDAHWAQLWPPIDGPQPRSHQSTIYDPIADRLVMFGGGGGWTSGEPLNDTWALALRPLGNWAPVTVSGSPPEPRLGHSAIYDPSSRSMVVFGGGQDNAAFSDVLRLSLDASPTWSRDPATSNHPLGRLLHASCYDPVRARMVIYGGDDRNWTRLGDTWGLDLTGASAWNSILMEPQVPAGRGDQAAIYDSLRDRMIIFGAGPTGNDTWALSLADPPTWSRIQTEGPLPPARSGHTAIYDSRRDELVIFGGLDYARSPDGKLNDAWALPLSGPATWHELVTSGDRPQARLHASTVYDAPRDRMVVFGGDSNGGLYYSDAFALSLGISPAWTSLTINGDPPRGLTGNSAILDAARHHMVVFGGVPLTNDLRVLSLDEPMAWNALAPGAVAPTSRVGPSAVYEPSGDRMLVFGGYGYSSVFNELWEHPLSDSATWRPLQPSGDLPPGRSFHTAIYDIRRNRMLIWGGFGAYEPLNDLWALDIAPRVATSAPGDPLTQFALAAPQPNPSRGSGLWISFNLAASGPATLQLFDISGRIVRTQPVGALGAGSHRLDVAAGARLAPGLYFVRLNQGARTATAKACIVQ